MPQEMHVLRCYSCETFQVHIVKKIPKWECKVCGEKQSVKKVYSRGSGKDCRLHVQELNRMRLENPGAELSACPNDVNSQPIASFNKNEPNRWVEFLSLPTHDDLDAEIEDSKFNNFTFERPSRKRKCNERYEALRKHDCNREKRKSFSFDAVCVEMDDSSENSVCDVPARKDLENQNSFEDSNANKEEAEASKWKKYINVSSPADRESPELSDYLKYDSTNLPSKNIDSLNQEHKVTETFKPSSLFSSQESNLDSVLYF